MDRQLDWFSSPKPGHIVQFYPYDSALLEPLTDYIGTGLKQGDTCIVVASPHHIADLDEMLATIRLNPEKLRSNGQYITMDAKEILKSFMIDSMPDPGLFKKAFENLVKKAVELGKPVRAYGEMVALLWQKYNHPAVIELERLWDELCTQYSLSLYCAYPKIHFDMELHSQQQNEISNCHNLALFT